MSTITEIFEKDPLSLTKDDIATTIEYFRTARHQFKLGDKTAGSPKKIKAPAGEKSSLKDVDLSFD